LMMRVNSPGPEAAGAAGRGVCGGVPVDGMRKAVVAPSGAPATGTGWANVLGDGCAAGVEPEMGGASGCAVTGLGATACGAADGAVNVLSS
jgi:hypothetical protein